MSEESTLIGEVKTTNESEKTATETAEQTEETKKTEEVAQTTKTEDGTANKVVDASESKDSSDGAPEKYEDFNLPEGVELNKEVLEQFAPVAKDLNLTQVQAQSIVDLQTKMVKEKAASQEASWKSINNDWQIAAKSDKEIGGPAFDQSLAQAKTFLTKFGTPELIEALNSTGMGNHPEFIRAFSRAGKAMGEDKLAIGGASTSTRLPEDILYPNQSST